MKFRNIVVFIVLAMLVSTAVYAQQQTRSPLQSLLERVGQLQGQIKSVAEDLSTLEDAVNTNKGQQDTWNTGAQNEMLQLQGAVDALGNVQVDCGCGSSESPDETQASGNIFIKFDGIDGESKEKDHKDWVEVLSYSHSMAMAGTSTGGGAGAGKVSFSDFSFVKTLDKSSPLLMKSSASGKHIKMVEVEVLDATGELYYKYTLEDVLVTSFSSSSSGDRPTEQVSLNFEKISVEYTPFDETGEAEGTIPFSWNIAENKE